MAAEGTETDAAEGTEMAAVEGIGMAAASGTEEPRWNPGTATASRWGRSDLPIPEDQASVATSQRIRR